MHVLFFRRLVALDGIIRHFIVTGQFRIGGGACGDDAGNAAQGVKRVGDDVRCAVFAVA